MHELSICNALLDQVRATARSRGADSVGRVSVRIGPLSGVEPDLLRRAFSLARAGALTGEAELVVETAPVRIRCLDCHAESAVEANRLICPQCSAYRVRLVSGDELLLTRIELMGQALAAPKAETKHV